MDRFFSYDPDGYGIELHATAKEAKAAAEAALQAYRDDAADGWNESVDGVCWGEIRERTEVISRQTGCEVWECGDDCEGHEYDEYIDYGLVPLDKEADDDA